MSYLLPIFLLGAMAAVVYALVTGIIAFLRTTEADLKNPNPGPSASAVKQNKAMWMRVKFQLLAIGIVVVMLLIARSGAHN